MKARISIALGVLVFILAGCDYHGSSDEQTEAIVAMILTAMSTPAPIEIPPPPTTTELFELPPAEAAPGAVWVNPKDGAEYAYVPAGTFMMGCSDEEIDYGLELCGAFYESLEVDYGQEQPLCERSGYLFITQDERPVHEVYVDGFWIMRTEVTNAQYSRCVEDGDCTEPENDRWNNSAYANYPVTSVSWHQANDYAAWAGGRLPMEGEWERACRGPEGSIYPWGNAAPSAERLNDSQSAGTMTEVGSYPAGAYGLHDMAGNVNEWTSSKYRFYPYDPRDGREDPGGYDIITMRTKRGGVYFVPDFFLRCADRSASRPDEPAYSTGFRAAMSPGP